MENQEEENIRKGKSIIVKFGVIDPRLDKAVRKYYNGRRQNDSAFNDIFEFYYDKGDLSGYGDDITIAEYNKLDWNAMVDVQAEVVESAELDDELFDYLRGIVDPDWYNDDDDDDYDDDDY